MECRQSEGDTASYQLTDFLTARATQRVTTPVDSGTNPQNMTMDETNFFSNSGAGIPRGVENSAVDADPSELSGGNTTLGNPVWRQYVANKDFQEANAGAIHSEQAYQNQTAQDNAMASRQDTALARQQSGATWGGDNGRLFHKVGRTLEEHDPNTLADDPVAGPAARKTLWDAERRKAAAAHTTITDALENPLFKEQGMSTKDYENAQAESSVLDKTDPRKAELDAKIQKANDHMGQRQEMQQAAWEAKNHHDSLTSMHPDEWWASRNQPSPTERRAATVATAQAGRDEADSMDAAAGQREDSLRAELAQGVKGGRSQEIQTELAQISNDRLRIAQERKKSDSAIAGVKQEAEAAVAPPEQKGVGDFLRGAEVALRQFPQLAYGVAGLVGATAEKVTGYGKGLKDWGFQGYQDAETKAQPLQRENDDVTVAWEKAKSGDIGAMVDWAQYGLGYALGQMGETVGISMLGGVVGGLAGGTVGTAVEPVGGTAVGAVGGAAGGAVAGLVAKEGLKSAAKGLIEKAIAHQALKIAKKEGVEMTAEQIAKHAASGEVRHAAAKELGSSVAVMANALQMELGSIYPEAEKLAREQGRELTGTDLARVWGWGLAAGGIEGLTEKLGVDLLKGKFASKLPKGRLAAGAVGGLADAAVEGGTEFVQTGMERLGAGQSITDTEAQNDYINSAAMGALGGAAVGGAGGAWNHTSDKPAPPAIKEKIDTHISAIDPEAPASTPEELPPAALLVHPKEGAAGVAQAVLIERDLEEVAAEDDAALSNAEQQHQDALETGDKGQVAAAEAAVEKAKKDSGRAPLVRAVTKVSSGRHVSELTDAELTAVGLKKNDKTGEVSNMTPKELDRAGLDTPLVKPGADGSAIVLDEAINKVKKISPKAGTRLKTSEGEQITKAQQRKAKADAEAAAKLSTVTPDGAQGEPATGGANLPHETKGAVEFDVALKNGGTQRVKAVNATQAEQEAAASLPMGEMIVPGSAKPVQSNEPNQPSETPPSQVPVPPVPVGQTGPSDAGAAGGITPTPEVAKAQAKEAVATTAAQSHVAGMMKRNQRLGSSITVTDDPAERAEMRGGRIFINPSRIIAEATAQGMNPAGALAYFKAVLDEEITHLSEHNALQALWKSEGSKGKFEDWKRSYGVALWDELGPDKQALARTIYTTTTREVQAAWDAMSPADKAQAAASPTYATLARWEAMGDDQKASEATRMFVQRRMKGASVTESAKLWMGDLGPRMKKLLLEMLRQLRALVKDTNLTPKLKDELDFLQANLTDLLKRDNIKTPAKESRPQATPKAGTDQASGEGGTAHPLVGQKVTFERDGSRVTGVVKTVAKDGRLLVRTDAGNVLIRSEDVIAETKPTEKTTEQIVAEGEAFLAGRGNKPENPTVKESLPVQTAQANPESWSDKNQKAHRKLEISVAKAQRANEWSKVISLIDQAEKDFTETNGFSEKWSDFERYREDAQQNIERTPLVDSILKPFTPLAEPPHPQPNPNDHGNQEKASAEAQSESVRQKGQVLNQPAAGETSPAALSSDEQALEDFLEDIGGGLEASPLTPSEFYRSKGIPKDKRAAFLDVADKLYEAGVRTPDDLAVKLAKIGGGKFKAYSHALWGGMVASYPELPNAEDWAGVYSALDETAKKAEVPADETLRDGNGGSTVADGTQGSAEERPGKNPSGSVVAGSRGGKRSGGIRAGHPDVGGRSDVPGGSVPGGDGHAAGGGNHNETPPGDSGRGRDEDRTGVRYGTRPDIGSPEANFVIGDGFAMPKGEKARIDANMKAIRLLREIEEQGRDATAEEKKTLAKYSGWGSFKNAFNRINQKNWTEINERINNANSYYQVNIRNSTEYQELSAWRHKWGELHDQLAEMLSPEEFRAMSKSIRNAHYTALPIIDSMWNMVRAMGFQGGNVLETSAGAGYFVGRQPVDLANASRWSAVELDSITARVFSKLYPEARINGNDSDPARMVDGQGFQKSKIPNNSMDLVIGNFPFAQDGPSESVKEFGKKLNLHNYFFARSIDKLKPGGIIIAITSNSTMDNNLMQRELLAGRVELVQAIRLPNDAFKESAGTEVTTDILILRKKDGSRDSKSESWINVESVGDDVVYAKPASKDMHEFLSSISAEWVPVDEELREPWKEWRARRPKTGVRWDDLIQAIRNHNYSEKGIPFLAPMVVNEYFARHPEAVIGRHALEGSMYRAGSYTVLSDGTDVQARLNSIAEALPNDLFGESTSEDADGPKTVEAGSQHRNGSIVLENNQPYHVINGQLVPIRWDLEYAEDFLFDNKDVKDALRGKLNVENDAKHWFESLSGKPLDDWLENFLEEHLSADASQKIRDKIKKETDRRNKVFASWVKVSHAARSLMDAELIGDPAAELYRDTLNKAYDEHVKLHGAFSARNRAGTPNPHRFLFDEEDSPLLESLEDEILTGTDDKGRPIYRYEKRSVFTESSNSSAVAPTEAQDIKDALGISMGYKGGISVRYMAELLKVTEDKAEKQLSESGLAFKNPKSGIYETSDIYLSGEVRSKLRDAMDADKLEPGSFASNIAALKAVQPKNRPIQAISIIMGARWLPGSVYEKFGSEMLGMDTPSIRYEQASNMWNVKTEGEKRRRGYRDERAQDPDYLGTDKMSAEEIFESIINSREIRIVKAGPTRGSVVLDTEATIEAQTKASQMMDKFSDWVKNTKETVEHEGDTMRIGDLAEREFNDKVAGLVSPTFTGEWVTLPGQSGEIWLKPHRKAVLARLLTMGYGMMAHGVGSGKTYNLIALAMELRRLGKARRPVTIVQNSTIRQFAASHMKAYPHARILVADESNFSARKRARFLAKIATGDYDSIIMTHSNISQIGHSEQSIRNYMARSMGEMEEILASSANGSQEQADIQEALDKLQEKLEKMLDKAMSRSKSLLTWEQLGVDALLVDEAHEFKNAPIITRKQRIKNLPSGEASDRAVMMQIKTASVQAVTGGKNVYFATGTPITNTMAEAYTMLKFISPTLMESKGIKNFDDFATMFGRTVTEPEATWRGEIELVERFAKFVNGPELVSLIRSVFDVSLGNDAMGLRVPKIKGGGPEMLIIEPTEASEIFNDWVIDTAAEFDGIENKRLAFEENPWMQAIPIMIMQAGMAQAIDPRLINPNAPDDPNSKVNQMVGRIMEIYKSGHERKTAQVVFTDLSNPFSTLLLKQFNGDPFAEYGESTPEMAALEQEIMSAPTETDAEKSAKQRLLARYNKLVEGRFSLMDDIKKKLIAQGIPAGEILSAESKLDKKKLQAAFDKVNSGEIRVIIGSTARLGVGVNIQERLAAAHNLSPPRDFKPAMMEQRLGRIERQGNLHRDWADQAFIDVAEKLSKQKFDAKKLEDRYEQAVDWMDKNGTEPMKAIARKAESKFEIIVINYGLKYSMDSSVYSMMKAKQKFIDQVLMGENVMDEFDDPMSAESNAFALMAAESMGDENLKRRVILDGELNKLKALRGAHFREIHNRENSLDRAKSEVNRLTKNDPAGIREEGKKFAGLFGRKMRTIKTTLGVLAKIGGEKVSKEDENKPAERHVEAAVYEFGDQKIDTAKPEGKITAPLNQFITDAMVDSKDTNDVVTRDIIVNGERFVFAVKHSTFSGGDYYSARIAWPGKVAGRVVFETSVHANGESPAQSLLDGLRSLSNPDYAERYASSIEAEIEQNKHAIEKLEPLVANPTPFADEAEWRDKSREMIDVNRLLAKSNSDPRKHRYYRSLSKMVGVDATDQILGLSDKPGLPEISPEVWKRMYIRFRLESRGVESNPSAISERLRSVVQFDTNAAQRETGQPQELGSGFAPITDDMISDMKRKLTPDGFLFPSTKYRLTEGKVIAMRRIVEKADGLLEKMEENSMRGVNNEEGRAHRKRVKELRSMRDKALAFIKQTDSGKLDDLHQGNQRGLRVSELPARLRADSPEWKAMSKAERMAYLKGRKSDLEMAVAVESTLSESDKQAAAEELGSTRWDDSTSSEFSSRLADWIITGKNASARLVALFEKAFKGLQMVFTSGFVAFGISHSMAPEVQAFSAQRIAVEMNQQSDLDLSPVTDAAEGIARQGIAAAVKVGSMASSAIASAKDITRRVSESPPVKRSSYGYVTPSANVRIMADWVMGKGDNQGNPFAIVDKKGGATYFFKADGILIEKLPSLTGRAVGDVLPYGKPEPWRVTPAGKFSGEIYNSEDYGPTIKFLRDGSNNFLIHAMPKHAVNIDARKAALKGVGSTKQTGACVNLDPKSAKRIIPVFNDGGTVYVLPETEGGKELFEGFKGLKASAIPESSNFTFAPNPKKVAELRDQQSAFDKQVVGAPRLANPGNSTRSRSEQDLVDQLYEEGRTVQKNADTMQEARRRFAADPGDIEAKLHDAATDKTIQLDASDHLAMQLLINQRSEEAGNDLAKHASNMALRMAYRIARGDVARALQIGYDRFMKPAERAQAALTEAIYAPTPKVEKIAAKLPAAKRMEFIQRESEKRVAAVEKELKKLGLTIAEISGQKRTLRLEKSQLMRDLLKARNIIDQGALKMVQAGASLADIKRRWGMKAEEAEKLNQAARAEIGEKIRTMLASGMSRDEVVKQLGGRLNAGELAPAGSHLTPQELNALVDQILVDDFGFPKSIPAQSLARVKPKVKAVTEMTAQELADAEAEAAKKTAKRWLEKLAKSQSDTLSWGNGTMESEMTKLIREHIQKAIPDFIQSAEKLGAETRDAEVIDAEAGEERKRIAGIKTFRQNNAKESADARIAATNTPEAIANRWIAKYAKIQSDTQAWGKGKKADEIGALIRQHIKEPMADFIAKATALGMTESQARVLDGEAARERNALAQIKEARKMTKKHETNPMTAQWSRPVFEDGMNSYEFDTKDRAGIIERVETIRALAHATGSIDKLQGAQRTKALEMLKGINEILAKYKTDAREIFKSGKPIEDYSFDINDINQVSAVARTISAIDADWIDKASEVLYSNMLSGLQTMMVNATAIVPAVWETTVGRGVEMAINRALGVVGLDDKMAASFGEEKYILKALAPAFSRALSNFQAAYGAQHPMFDRDVLAHEIDWEKILGGKGYRVGGSISGKWGDRVRIPMRILAATDDFNRTLMACAEVGTFAYRLARAQGMKPGTAEFDRFLKTEVNTPGSRSYQLAASKASRAIFSNPLPGQKDLSDGETVGVHDLGDLAGLGAAALNKFVTQDHDNMFIKASLGALRLMFFPFQRTPFNILRKGVRYTLNPFSLFDIGLGIVQNSKTDTGGWKWNAKGRNPELIERAGMQLQGAILMLLIAGIGAGEGDDDDQDKALVITGSAPFTPRGRAERDAQQRSGIGPYRISFRRKDGSERFGFNYGRLEPMATTLAASIDLMKSVKRTLRGGGDASQAAGAALGGFASQAQDKSFMKGISDLVSLGTNLLADPDLKDNRKMQQFVAARFAMAMPNIIKQPIREADDNFRDKSDGFMQELMYQMVPYGQKAAKVDTYGDEAKKVGTSVSRIADVTEAGTDTVEAHDEMLMRFRDKHPDKAWFPAPIVNAKFKNTRTGKEEDMSEPQLEEFKTLAGKRVAALLKLEVFNMKNPTEFDIDKMKKAVTKGRTDMKHALSFKFSRQ